MNAEIDERGRLIVRPTTQTEETALKAWKEKASLRQVNWALNEEWHCRGTSILLMAHRKGSEQ